MNNPNDPTSVPTEAREEQAPPQVVPIAPEAPVGKPCNSTVKKALIAGLILLLLALVPLAYAMGRMDNIIDLSKNISVGDTSTPSDTNPVEEPEKPVTEEIAVYNGWATYTHPTLGYSFKYPSDWQVNRRVIQEPGDRVSINPPGKANLGNGDALAIFTYFDGTGCPNTTKKEFMIGGYGVEGIACEGTELYRVGMQHSKTVGVEGGIVLARVADNSVGIQIDMSIGEDEAVRRVLDSIAGLNPSGS